MKYSKVLATLALAFAFALFSADASAAQFFLKVTGTVQGAFKGENAAGQIPLVGYSFQVSRPFDPSSGQVSGNQLYQPIVITKNLDLATPQFLQALIANETLTTVVIEAYRTTKDGKIASAYTITLTNVSVVGLTQTAEANDQPSEQISLNFQKIKVSVADLSASDTR